MIFFKCIISTTYSLCNFYFHFLSRCLHEPTCQWNEHICFVKNAITIKEKTSAFHFDAKKANCYILHLLHMDVQYLSPLAPSSLFLTFLSLIWKPFNHYLCIVLWIVKFLPSRCSLFLAKRIGKELTQGKGDFTCWRWGSRQCFSNRPGNWAFHKGWREADHSRNCI